MGSATRGALARAVATLNAQAKVDLATGEQLFAASLVLDGSPQLAAALADDTAEDANRKGIVAAVFAKYGTAARSVIETLSTERWSSEDDLIAGMEELGIRAVAESAPKSLSIEDELFAFVNAVTSDSELELALGSKLGTVEGKISIIHALLDGKASAQTIAILTALVAQPRGRRIGELIRYATSIVADQSNLIVANVTVARPIEAKQLDRLVAALTEQYGRAMRVQQVVDPSIVGGIRVQIGDDVIDGSIANRIADLRLRLAS
ncbi:MAG: F-type H+-transporting ATPase subunit delta [Actinomycetota bacterium]|jgi:F-type H+-transporting ATPase subunit delta|nr:synthase subunit delta [Glaciihabitans sp.]MDQ1543941.1 F-type H+-transporting ATPase subunit delta [Actinomycetota bacterium]MDQ1560698.1 F-type H+-transporting ATPase subunit delta [Actinomycetota bacterium]